MTIRYNQKMQKEYQDLYDGIIFNPKDMDTISRLAKRLHVLSAPYQLVCVQVDINIPWEFVGIIHLMESNCNFDTHLHNGDPLNKRTVNVPAGRPKTGTPPFTWTDSAIDALRMKKIDKVQDWSIPDLLWQFEKWNGFGYRNHGIHSPYLWAGCNHYKKGKYVADGKWSPMAVSKQIGAAVIMRYLNMELNP